MYLTQDIIVSFDFRQKYRYPHISVRDAIKNHLSEGVDYTRNSQGFFLVTEEGAKKLKEYYLGRGMISKDAVIKTFNPKLPLR